MNLGNDICMTASYIRAETLGKRASLSQDAVDSASKLVGKRILELDSYKNSEIVGSYFGVRGEIDPSSLSSVSGPKHAFPVMKSDGTLRFLIPEGPLKTRKYEIKEPSSGEEINPRDLDLVLVPLVAVDLNGNRIGHGAGFYDKTFSFLKSESGPELIGLAHEFQIFSSIDPEPWDVPLDLLVTENEVYRLGMNHPTGSMGED